MRDINRLDNFYNELKNIHKEFFPDWRFGQFIVNFTDWIWGEKRVDIFFPRRRSNVTIY